MNSSSLTILGFLLLSAPALAEDIYRFTVDQRQGDEVVPLGAFLGQGSVKGTVILDGGKYRLELAPDPEDVRPFEVVISHDGGGREIALNPRNHTYFEPKESEITSPLLLLLPSPGDRSVVHGGRNPRGNAEVESAGWESAKHDPPGNRTR